MSKRGDIIIVSAPSGSGKTTIVSRLIKEMSGVNRAVSYTTRDPREGEVDGKDYIFVSREEFKKKIESGEFLECEENFDNYYGTAKKQVTEAVEKGFDIILSIDIKGMRTVKDLFPECISIFIMPPSMDELAARLKNRKTDAAQQVSMRLKESQVEMAARDEYDYLIINKDLDEAINEMKTIIGDVKKSRKKGQKEDGGK